MYLIHLDICTRFQQPIHSYLIYELLYDFDHLSLSHLFGLSGDGMFFQWILCLSIWLVGFGLQLYRNSAFEPYSAFGGMFWASGNVLTVPIISSIGLGLGMLVWGISSLLTGWASAKFGFFGITVETVSNPTLNIIGVGVLVISLIVVYFIEPEEDCVVDSDDELFAPTDTYDDQLDYRPLPKSKSTKSFHSVGSQGLRKSKSFVAMNKKAIKNWGFPLAVCAGILFGLCFNPAQFLIDHPTHGIGPAHSTESLDYVFSQFSGIFVTSTFYFLMYCVYKKNKPVVYPELVLPAFVSGALWAVAQIAWFVANENLSFVISFPVITTAPALLATSWGVFLFGEIKGTRNFLLLFGSFLVSGIGITCIVISR